MSLENNYRPADDTLPTAECLVGRLEEVRGFLHRRRFSEHAIEHAITVVCRVAVPYINGNKICKIKNRRAWVYKVAIRAAKRAMKAELSCVTFDPGIMAAMVQAPGSADEQSRVDRWLNQLTQKQRDAVDLCILGEMSQRDAAEEMGIAVSTLRGHLDAAVARLKEIVTKFELASRFPDSYPPAHAS